MASIYNMITLVLLSICCILSQGFPFDDDWFEAGGMFNSQGMQNQGMQNQGMMSPLDDDVYENPFYNQFLQYLAQMNPFLNPSSNTTSTASTSNSMMGYFYNPFMNFYNPFNSFYNLFDKKR